MYIAVDTRKIVCSIYKPSQRFTMRAQAELYASAMPQWLEPVLLQTSCQLDM